MLKDHPNYSLKANDGPITESRQEADQQSGALTIAAFEADKDIEERLTPIRIPILKGLLGHRIFIIREGEQKRFSRINSFNDLLKLKAGQGKLWSDTQILKSSG
ncbi:hypothetical protein [Catenovulum adriaticum]|uniref:Uncharacterized protein n=1 Tax=Catenovulum adriaticum TaxID=2984846 RepID=A0ABY7AQD4_9ALTE|nr:hypothetical protein [Catenovulum sp. TS8]WAJ71765.1 hypothetical protein OLW01_15615 [Catenovulum sp. TS8]